MQTHIKAICILRVSFKLRPSLKVIVGTDFFPIRLASYAYMSGRDYVILETKSHREIMLNVIFSLCVQSVKFHR